MPKSNHIIKRIKLESQISVGCSIFSDVFHGSNFQLPSKQRIPNSPTHNLSKCTNILDIARKHIVFKIPRRQKIDKLYAKIPYVSLYINAGKKKSDTT